VSHRIGDNPKGLGALLFFVIGSFLCANSPEASEAEFVGTVTNTAGEAIQYVAVDILGPRKIFTRTDSDGRFKVDLIDGRYTVRLRYKKSTTDFSIRVGGDSGVSSRTFILEL
jgi:hypothetical protein